MADLTIGFQNINGLRGKDHLIIESMKTHKIDILILTETWLTPGDTNPLKNITAIDERHPKRKGRPTGGICVICQEYNTRLLVNKDLVHESKNVVSFYIHNIKFIACYFSPQKNQDTLFFETSTNANESIDEKIYILGDFNAHHKSTGSPINCIRGRWMIENLDNLTYCHPTSGSATSLNSNRRPDHLLTNDLESYNNDLKVTDTDHFSDHYLEIFSIKIPRQSTQAFKRVNIGKLRNQKIKERYSKNLNKIFNPLRGQMSKLSLEQDQASIDQIWENIRESIQLCLEETLGIFEYRPSFNTAYRNTEIEELEKQVQLCQELRKIQPRNPVHQRALNIAKSQWKIALEKRKKTMYQKFADALEQGSNGAFLRMVNNSTARESRKQCKLKVENLERDKEVYRKTIGVLPKGRITQEQILDNEKSDPGKDWSGSDPVNFSMQEVWSIVKWNRKGKAAGVDEIPCEAYQVLLPDQDSHSALETISKLFSICATSCKIPSQWKKAVIVPVHKKGDPEDPSNYRPIALTVVLRRTYEKLIESRIITTIEKYLSPNQNGFRRKRNTLQQVLVLKEALEKNPNLIVIFLDIMAAYDTVDRRILWWKLRNQFHLPYKVIANLRALFDNNTIQVRLKGHLSTEIPCNRGLLQGSSLSPILFNCFINDLIIQLNELPKTSIANIRINNLFFADDGAIFSNRKSNIDRLLKQCETWSQENGIQFKPAKSAVMGDNSEYKLYSEVIPNVHEYTYLGIVMCKSGVNWKETIIPRLKKAEMRAQIFSRKGLNGGGWPMHLSIIAYKTFIRPMIEYGLQLQQIPSNMLEKVESLQNKTLKMALSVPQQTSTLAINTVTGMATMKERNTVLNARFFYYLYKNSNSEIPAVQIMKECIKKPKIVGRHSSFRKAKINKLYKELTRNVNPNDITSQNPNETKQTIKKWQNGERSKKLDKESESVARSLHDTRHDYTRPNIIYRKEYHEDREKKRLILLWQLGRICFHQCQCAICGTSLSRKHGIECSGAHYLIKHNYFSDDVFKQDNHNNIISKAINEVTHTNYWEQLPTQEQDELVGDISMLNTKDKKRKKKSTMISYNVNNKRKRLTNISIAIKKIMLECYTKPP